MSEVPELSIIVPVYKVEQYLRRCIDSILAQTFTDFELILIDDGSPDQSGEIIEEYAAKDSRIITIHQENKGVSSARNAGLRIARGTYVGFVDPDDWIEPTMYQSLVSTMVNECADIVCCNIYKVTENGVRTVNTEETVPYYLNREELRYHIIKNPSTINGWTVNKLYRRSLIREFFDESKKICEDTKFVLHYCNEINEAFYLSMPLYNYYIRSDSAMYANKGAYALGLCVKRELCMEYYTNGESIAALAEDDYLDSCCLCMKYTINGEKNEYYRLAREELTNYVKEHGSFIWKNRRMSIKKKAFVLFYAFRAAVELKRLA